jgi:hypothetical protein
MQTSPESLCRNRRGSSRCVRIEPAGGEDGLVRAEQADSPPSPAVIADLHDDRSPEAVAVMAATAPTGADVG